MENVMIRNDFLIESPWTEKFGTFNFLHTDTKELFEKNREKLGPEWRYYNEPVTYTLNDLGYRMEKEMHEVDYDNYIAFFGCSYAYGIGMPLEDSFAYITAKRAKCDYVNGAICGASPDFVYTNFLHFFEKVPKKPKCFIFVWPAIVRTFYWYKNDPIFLIPNNEERATTYWNKAYKDFIMEESHIHNRFKYIRSAIKIICESNKIPYYESTLYQSEDFSSKYTGITVPDKFHPVYYILEQDPKVLHLNWGRDIIKMSKTEISAHPGTYCQHAMSDNFFTKFGHLLND